MKTNRQREKIKEVKEAKSKKRRDVKETQKEEEDGKQTNSWEVKKKKKKKRSEEYRCKERKRVCLSSPVVISLAFFLPIIQTRLQRRGEGCVKKRKTKNKFVGRKDEEENELVKERSRKGEKPAC